MPSADSDEVRNRQPTFQTTNNAYILPNDPKEHQRLADMHEALLALSHGQIVSAPVDKSSIKKVVDVGCGAGATTRDLWKYFPDASTVYGIDLSPVPAQAGDEDDKNGDGKDGGGRARLEFIQGDIMELAGHDPRLGWGSVDLVWHRLLICGLTDWPGYASRAFKLLKPGCWAQMSEWTEDVYFDTDPSSADASDDRPQGFVAEREWEWLRAMREGGRAKGLDVDAGLNMPRYMRDAGFVDVQLTELRVPYWKGALDTQPEARKATEHYIGDRFALFWHMLPRITETLGYSEEKIKQLQHDCRRDLGEEKGKYQTFFVTIGRKPDVGEV